MDTSNLLAQANAVCTGASTNNSALLSLSKETKDSSGFKTTERIATTLGIAWLLGLAAFGLYEGLNKNSSHQR